MKKSKAEIAGAAEYPGDQEDNFGVSLQAVDDEAKMSIVILEVAQLRPNVVWLRDGRRCNPGEIVSDLPTAEAEELCRTGRAVREADLKPIKIKRSAIENYLWLQGVYAGFDVVIIDGTVRIMHDAGDERLFEVGFSNAAFMTQDDYRDQRIEAAIPRIMEKVIFDALKSGFRVSLI